jgi:hypothetical protein
MLNYQVKKILTIIKYKSQMITVFKMKMKQVIKVQEQKVAKECKMIGRKESIMNHLL